MRKITTAALLLLASAAPAAAATQTVFTADFEAPNYYTLNGANIANYSLNGASLTGSESFPGFGANYIRNDTTGVSSITLSGLQAHSSVTLALDVALIDSWDGLIPGSYSPDLFTITVDGIAYDISHDNYTNNSDPASYTGLSPDQSFGQYGVNGGFNDLVLRYQGANALTFNTSASTLTISFQAHGSGFQGGSDESWGIDNLSLTLNDVRTTAPAVPEPATWAMMLTGFGLVGGALRRRGKLALA
jgi:hypothetical protein